jgi:hypothetical protein
VPLGLRLSVVPVPGVPEVDGKVNDWPGVGAGVGPVPLGTELPGVEPVVDVPPVAPVLAAPPVLAPPPLVPPDPPLWPNADTAPKTTEVATNNTDDLGSMRILRATFTLVTFALRHQFRAVQKP